MSVNGKSILVIDDDAAMLRALNKVLMSEGAIVGSASWAGEALDHLTARKKHFDLVITDLQMPILGGRTILGAMATALPDVPVIVITAFGNPEVKVQCLRAGAAAFLEKPLDTAQLLDAIDHALSQPRPRSGRATRRSRGVKEAKGLASGNHENCLACPEESHLCSRGQSSTV